jgi:hypothetical protein
MSEGVKEDMRSRSKAREAMAINAWAPEVEGGEIKGLKWFEHV